MEADGAQAPFKRVNGVAKRVEGPMKPAPRPKRPIRKAPASVKPMLKRPYKDAKKQIGKTYFARKAKK